MVSYLVGRIIVEKARSPGSRTAASYDRRPAQNDRYVACYCFASQMYSCPLSSVCTDPGSTKINMLRFPALESPGILTECLRLRLGVSISRMLCLRAACYWLSAWQQAGAVHHGTGTAAIVNVHRFITKSSLFTCKWVG